MLTHRRSFDEYTTTRAGPNQVLFFSFLAREREARFRGLGHAVGSTDTPLRVTVAWRGARRAKSHHSSSERRRRGLKRRRERRGRARVSYFLPQRSPRTSPGGGGGGARTPSRALTAAQVSCHPPVSFRTTPKRACASARAWRRTRSLSQKERRSRTAKLVHNTLVANVQRSLVRPYARLEASGA